MAVDYSTAVTDRNAFDLQRFHELDAKRFPDMTEEEQAEWLAGLKACYNFADVNRVGEFVSDLARRLHDEAGVNVNVNPKTDWTVEDIPTPKQLSQYIADIHALKNALAYVRPGGVPDSMEGLTLIGANAIEQLCINLNQVLINLSKSQIYSGDIFAGEI